MEQQSLPPHARITWLVGPPGAGKSTLARQQTQFERVVELTEMLRPVVDASRIRKGVLGANGRLVELIRALEFHPENRSLPSLLVVAGIVPEEKLFPIQADEAIWLILPERERWRLQLHQRVANDKRPGPYDDFSYSEIWYDRFSAWQGQPGVHVIDTPFDRNLVGVS